MVNRQEPFGKAKFGGLIPIEEYAEKNNVPIMQKDGIEFLTKYIKENNIKEILEIGSAIGYSAIKMALIDKNIKVTTIERDKERYEIAIKNIKNMELENQIEIYNEDALEFNIEKKYDLIFIDAAKAQYIKFFEKYKKNLKQKGTIISDNLEFHGLVKNPELTNNRNTKQLALPRIIILCFFTKSTTPASYVLIKLSQDIPSL